MPQLLEYAHTVAQSVSVFHGANPVMETVLSRRGVEWVGRPLTSRLRRGPFGQCFRNTYRVVQRNPNRYHYCEGLALRPGLIPMHHAWLLDLKDFRVTDVTWDDPEHCEYLGIAFTYEITKALREQTGCTSVFMDLYGRNNVVLMKALLEGIKEP